VICSKNYDRQNLPWKPSSKVNVSTAIGNTPHIIDWPINGHPSSNPLTQVRFYQRHNASPSTARTSESWQIVICFHCPHHNLGGLYTVGGLMAFDAKQPNFR
jgi:hypothetical protein